MHHVYELHKLLMNDVLLQKFHFDDEQLFDLYHVIDQYVNVMLLDQMLNVVQVVHLLLNDVLNQNFLYHLYKQQHYHHHHLHLHLYDDLNDVVLFHIVLLLLLFE